MENITNVEKVLNEGKLIQFTPKGTSMYPLFITRKDTATVLPVSRLNRKVKRGDVCLYKRADGMLVIHRIFKVAKEGVYMVGDHQIEIEGPLEPEQVKGVMVSFVRNGREYSCTNPIYIILSKIWLFIRPIRLKLIKTGSKIKKCIN